MMAAQSKIDDIDHTFRNYALQYFRIHADQRLRVFQFYIAVSTALLGGAVVALKLPAHHMALIVIGILLMFFSFIFNKLDVRTRELVKNGENALRKLDALYDLPEEDGAPSRLELFARDDFLVSKPHGSPKQGHFSYRKCFVWVFCALGAIGFLAFAWGIKILVCGI